MNQKVLKTIEYTKIIALLKEEAGSALGKEKAESLLPSSRREEVEKALLETEDAENLLFGVLWISVSFSRDSRWGRRFLFRSFIPFYRYWS